MPKVNRDIVFGLILITALTGIILVSAFPKPRQQNVGERRAVTTVERIR